MPDNLKPLKQTLLERIETEQVCPRSRLFFRSRECFVWTLWLVSVIVGALAVAVSLFVVMHRQYALYEATHDNFLTFMVAVLPYLWIFTFGAMVLFATYNLRHTKHGYRYSLLTIIGSSVVLSFAGGAALQFFGLGYTIDRELGQQLGMYRSQAKLEQQLWQAPEQGRLMGRQVLSTVTPTSTVIFEDMVGSRWQLTVDELNDEDLALLATMEPVRLLGAPTDVNLKQFHACGAFPWMFDRQRDAAELDAARERFLRRVYEMAETPNERLQLLETEVFTTEPAVTSKRCSEIAAVNRMMQRERGALVPATP